MNLCVTINYIVKRIAAYVETTQLKQTNDQNKQTFSLYFYNMCIDN